MELPAYVNPNALLSEEDLHQVVMAHPSTTARAKLFGHLAVTHAVLGELATMERAMREYYAAWLDQQGGVYTAVARALREGKTPTLEQPAPPVPASEAMDKLRADLEEDLRQLAALRAEVAQLRAAASTPVPAPEAVRPAHPKPWAVRRKDGTLDYYDNRATARREARGGIVVDCR